MSEHDEVSRQVLQTQGQVRELSKQHQDLTEQLQALRDRKARSGRLDEARAILVQVREAFHWGGLPQTVSQLNLDKMQDSVNNTLDLFGSPFAVTTGDALTFNVTKPGHTAHRAERASVGQLGVLSIALRLTVNQVFGTDLGLMVLDEPTEGLDNQNLQLFQEALAQLATNVQGERQVILISHVPGLTDSCDQIIELESA
jgi:DNA repair exonuclease SbcCD ATPase subunit